MGKLFIGNKAVGEFDAARVTGQHIQLNNFVRFDEAQQNGKLEKQLKTIKAWAHVKASEFPQEWTEDDELDYRSLFGKSLMVLPEEVEQEEE